VVRNRKCSLFFPQCEMTRLADAVEKVDQ